MPQASRRPPNILLITSDQQHFSTLGCINPAIQTPALDRLAQRGIRFDRAYCPNPTCTPTRASILTGLYPSAHGAYTLGTKLDERIPTVGDHLRTRGYRSSLIGKAHFQPLRSMPDCPSIESYPTLRDLDFWRGFNGRGTPWYGFDHIETCRNHTDESHVGQHYALWLEQQGFGAWRDYFQPWAQDPTGHRASPMAPKSLESQGPGFRAYEPWKLPAELHYTTWTGQRTIAAIEEAVDDERPFFIWSSYHDPHPPYAVPDPWFSLYDPAAMEEQIGRFVEGEFDRMPPPHQWTRQSDRTRFDWMNEDGRGSHGCHPHLHDRELLKKMCAVYFGMISFMDLWIGRTLDRLEQLRQLENTLVLFTSDHGHFIGQHGLVAKGPFHYEDVIRVPMIASMPGTLPQGEQSSAIQSLVDFAPTFLDAAGLAPRIDMQGRSMLGSWAGKSAGSRSQSSRIASGKQASGRSGATTTSFHATTSTHSTRPARTC